MNNGPVDREADDKQYDFLKMSAPAKASACGIAHDEGSIELSLRGRRLSFPEYCPAAEENCMRIILF